MAREVDDRATRKALARIRRAKAAVERAIAASPDPDAAETARIALSDWETEFIASVEQRLSVYGSAFADPGLGEEGEALSRLQIAKLKEIEKKASGKGQPAFGSGQKARSSFKSTGSGGFRGRSRNINADLDAPGHAPEDSAPAELDPLGALEEDGRIRRGLRPIDGDRRDAPVGDEPTPASPRPRLRIIDGGREP